MTLQQWQNHSPSSAQHSKLPICCHLVEHPSQLLGRPQQKLSGSPPVLLLPLVCHGTLFATRREAPPLTAEKKKKTPKNVENNGDTSFWPSLLASTSHNTA